MKAAAELRLLPLGLAHALGTVDRPAYAYGLMRAASEARVLGYPGITAIEFGVGAGNGLLKMEEHGDFVSRATGVSINIVGFDTGKGLPEPVDFRDLPSAWARGFYPLDEPALRSRLQRAELVLGDVRETVGPFLDERERDLLRHPIGFVVFDLDYWSSTIAAFDIFRHDSSVCLPRVTCYFDNIPHTVEDVGELRAIADFNQEQHDRRIRHQFNLRASIPFDPAWAGQIHQAHLFGHPRYSTLLADPEVERVTLRR